MFILRKLLFKFMELGLGLKAFFALETKNPIFLNFKLSADEAKKVQDSLPQGFQLEKIRFTETDTNPEYWVSYNLYEIDYPKEELKHIKKSRCEINTFVTDSQGRRGILVFSESPYVSKETKVSFFGVICDFAEKLVQMIYGCGELISLKFFLTKDRLVVNFQAGPNHVEMDEPVEDGLQYRLSSDYWEYNDISFFNHGKSLDYVNVNSAFYAAKFCAVSEMSRIQVSGPFFRRSPDVVLYHRGVIPYLVDAMNKNVLPAPQRELSPA